MESERRWEVRKRKGRKPGAPVGPPKKGTDAHRKSQEASRGMVEDFGPSDGDHGWFLAGALLAASKKK